MVVRILELLFISVGIFGGGGGIGYALYRRNRPSTPDKCKHKRWTKWEIVQSVNIHLYAEVDEGKGLPDRVDDLVKRTCISCGLRQMKTVRGVDSRYYK